MTSPLPLAVQLYSFRDDTRRGSAAFTLDRGLLDQLARLGYGGVETVGVPGGDVAAARAALADAGLAVTSTHSWASIDDADAFDRICADAAAIGSPRVIVSGHRFDTHDDVRRFADSLNAGATTAARHGLRVGIHNHDGEMQDVEGAGPGYALLRDATGPTVDFQVDIFWVVVGGASPDDRHPRPRPARLLDPPQGRSRAATERERRSPVRQRCGRQRRREPGAGHRGARRCAERGVADRRARPRRRPGDRRRDRVHRVPRRARPRPLRARLSGPMTVRPGPRRSHRLWQRLAALRRGVRLARRGRARGVHRCRPGPRRRARRHRGSPRAAAGRPARGSLDRRRRQPHAPGPPHGRQPRRDRGRQARVLREAAGHDAGGREGDGRGRRCARRPARLRPGHVPRRRAPDRPRRARRGIDRRAARGAMPPSSTSGRSAGTRTRRSSSRAAAARCSTSGRTTSPRSSTCSARSPPSRRSAPGTARSA